MNEINELKNIKSNLMHELIEISKKDGQLQNIDTLSHAIKNICKIIEECEKEEMGYSGAGRYSMGYYDMPYSGNYAGARGRGSQANRDSMGRYSSHGDLRNSLYDAMSFAQNDMERNQIQNLINNLPM